MYDMYDDDSIKPLIDQFPRLFHGKPPEVASSVPRGWVPLVTRLLQDIDAMLDDEQAKRFHVLQVKEKLAGLRVYWRLGAMETSVLDIFAPHRQRLDLPPSSPSALFARIAARVDQAEAEASSSCQCCGAEGAKVGGRRGWLVTLCTPCRALQGEES